MALRSPSSSSSAAKLVFGSGADAESSPGDPSRDTADNEDHAGDGERVRGTSMYVTLFEEMLKVVIEQEHHLFTCEELHCFMAWHKLPENAKYLFCRLCLRSSEWYRMDSLKYYQEMDEQGILNAMEILCRRPSHLEDPKPKIEPFPDILPSFLPFEEYEDIKPKIEPETSTIPPGPEIINLIEDEDDQPRAGPSRLSPEVEPALRPSSSTPSSTSRAVDYSIFADDEEQADNRELLDCLRVEELSDLAKRLKFKRSMKRDNIIEAILRGSATQTTLSFPHVSKKGKEPMVQTKLSFNLNKTQKALMQAKLPFKPTAKTQETQQTRLRAMVMEKLKKCIRLNPNVLALFRRTSLVFFRHTQHTPMILTPAILARAKKREYAVYKYTRTPDIWATREDLLAYEDALEVEAEVDALLDGYGAGSGSGYAGRARSTASRTPAPLGGQNRFRTPVTPAKTGSRVDSPVVVKKENEEQESQRVRNAQKVKEILEEVRPKWEALLKEKGGDGPRPRKGLERFECGHILTRVVCKGAYALSILKEFKQEVGILQKLLAQKRWRRARRGRWYQRYALVLMNYFKDEGGQEQARGLVMDALKDQDTHIVFRPALQQRLRRLENLLKLAEGDRHICEGSLEEADLVFVEGVRKRSLVIDHGRVVNQSPEKTEIKGLWKELFDSAVKVKQEVQIKSPKAGGKSVWEGREPGEEVSVETLALQWYEDNQGCKGFHSEGRIVTTLFGLLFWDVIFAPIPGAFETPYQRAPLDLAEDTFYYSREELADARLEEIEEGRAPEIIEKAYEEHHGVVCVGVRWDLYTKEDLVGLVTCIPPTALVAICRLMCEDYAARTGGVPDLIVWNEAEKSAKFVEVKGPDDKLQENQKVWVDVLLHAGMPVELCHVHEPGEKPNKLRSKGPAKTPKKASARKRKRVREREDVESEDEEIDYSQLDRHPEEDGEEEAEIVASQSPAKKRRITRGRGKEERVEPESPTRRKELEKVARVSSQVEVVIISSQSSPRKRKRVDDEA